MAVQAGDVLRVAARMTIQGRGDVVNVYHVRVGPIEVGATEQDVLDYCAAYMEQIYTPLRAEMVNELTFEDINVFNVTRGTPVGLVAWPTLQYGARTTEDALPGQLAALVRFTTGYSRNWARKFLGVFTEYVLQGEGRLSVAFVGILANYAAAVLAGYTAIDTTELTAVVYNKALEAYVELQEAVIRNVWSTVRSRREGRGS